MTLQVGDHGYDDSFSDVDDATLKAHGGKFLLRYLSGNTRSGKDWTAERVTQAQADGLVVGAYWETSATRMEAGYAAGAADAGAALTEAAAVGYAGPIWFARDDNSPLTAASKGYVDGACATTSRAEFYGSIELLDYAGAAHGRVHGAHVSTWGTTDGNAGFQQEANYHTVPGTDDLTLLKADTFGGAAPIPSTSEDDMIQFIHDGTGPWWALHGDYKWYVPAGWPQLYVDLGQAYNIGGRPFVKYVAPQDVAQLPYHPALRLSAPAATGLAKTAPPHLTLVESILGDKDLLVTDEVAQRYLTVVPPADAPKAA